MRDNRLCSYLGPNSDTPAFAVASQRGIRLSNQFTRIMLKRNAFYLKALAHNFCGGHAIDRTH